jgi:putative tributyrin esterase
VRSAPALLPVNSRRGGPGVTARLRARRGSLQFACMPWAQVHWRSEVLDKQTEAQVLLPRVGRGPFPVLYLLHGISGDSTNWVRHSRIEWYVRELPLIVVMPDGYRGFYTDNEQGPAFARHFGVELIDFVDGNFRTRPERSARAIGGLSMGGYGALRIGLGFADKFISVNSHSGALGRSKADFSHEAEEAGRHRDKPREFLAELRRIFGARPNGTDHDILLLAERAQQAGKLPHLLIDCGTEDFLLDDNRDFHRLLKDAGIPHDYREHKGAHDWDYWDRHVQDALTWHCRHLGIEKSPIAPR